MDAIPQISVTPEQIQAIEMTERDLWESLWQALPPAEMSQLGLHTERFGDGTAIMFDAMPDWFFNRVIGLGVKEPVSVDSIRALIDLYSNKRLPFAISLSPYAEPANIAAELQAMGFKNRLDWAKMIRGMDTPPLLETGLKIEELTTPQHDTALDVICEGFELPDMMRPIFSAALNMANNHCYLAWEGENAVAFSVLSVFGDIGHLNTTCTRPQYRRRGAQSALMVHRIQHGIELGCKAFMTETGIVPDQPNPSLQNMVRCGFKMAYARPNFVFGGDK